MDLLDIPTALNWLLLLLDGRRLKKAFTINKYLSSKECESNLFFLFRKLCGQGLVSETERLIIRDSCFVHNLSLHKTINYIYTGTHHQWCINDGSLQMYKMMNLKCLNDLKKYQMIINTIPSLSLQLMKWHSEQQELQKLQCLFYVYGIRVKKQINHFFSKRKITSFTWSFPFWLTFSENTPPIWHLSPRNERAHIMLFMLRYMHFFVFKDILEKNSSLLFYN